MRLEGLALPCHESLAGVWVFELLTIEAALYRRIQDVPRAAAPTMLETCLCGAFKDLRL